MPGSRVVHRMPPTLEPNPFHPAQNSEDRDYRRHRQRLVTERTRAHVMSLFM